MDDLRDGISSSSTIGSYIRTKHTSTDMGDDPEKYIQHIKEKLANGKPPTDFSPDDPAKGWVADYPNGPKWKALTEAFRMEEGWVEGKTYDAGNIGTASSKPEDAPLVAYYKGVLGVPAAPAAQPAEQTPPKP